MAQAFKICYLQRTDQKDKALGLLAASGLLESNLSQPAFASTLEISLNGSLRLLNESKESALQVKSASLDDSLNASSIVDLKGAHSIPLQYVIDNINANIPLLLVTND